MNHSIRLGRAGRVHESQTWCTASILEIQTLALLTITNSKNFFIDPVLSISIVQNFFTYSNKHESRSELTSGPFKVLSPEEANMNENALVRNCGIFPINQRCMLSRWPPNKLPSLREKLYLNRFFRLAMLKLDEGY